MAEKRCVQCNESVIAPGREYMEQGDMALHKECFAAWEAAEGIGECLFCKEKITGNAFLESGDDKLHKACWEAYQESLKRTVKVPGCAGDCSHCGKPITDRDYVQAQGGAIALHVGCKDGYLTAKRSAGAKCAQCFKGLADANGHAEIAELASAPGKQFHKGCVDAYKRATRPKCHRCGFTIMDTGYLQDAAGNSFHKGDCPTAEEAAATGVTPAAAATAAGAAAAIDKKDAPVVGLKLLVAADADIVADCLAKRISATIPLDTPARALLAAAIHAKAPEFDAAWPAGVVAVRTEAKHPVRDAPIDLDATGGDIAAALGHDIKAPCFVWLVRADGDGGDASAEATTAAADADGDPVEAMRLAEEAIGLPEGYTWTWYPEQQLHWSDEVSMYYKPSYGLFLDEAGKWWQVDPESGEWAETESPV